MLKKRSLCSRYVSGLFAFRPGENPIDGYSIQE